LSVAAAGTNGHWMHVEGLVLQGLLMLLPAAATSLKPLFLMTTTTPSRCCLPVALQPVSSLSPSINSLEIPFLFTMLNACVSGANHA
jgi:hypothetical protein